MRMKRRRVLCVRPGRRTDLSLAIKSGISSTKPTHKGQLVKGTKQQRCKACQAGSRMAPKRIRIALGEMSSVRDQSLLTT